MILLLGSNAYSPFRLDALRAAIAKLDPTLGPVEIDAKWVYALQTKGDSFDSDELRRAESLLNAEGDCREAIPSTALSARIRRPAAKTKNIP